MLALACHYYLNGGHSVEKRKQKLCIIFIQYYYALLLLSLDVLIMDRERESENTYKKSFIHIFCIPPHTFIDSLAIH